MAQRLRYPAAVRLRRKREYERVFREGVRVRDRWLKMVVAAREDPTLPSRLGTAVSRKVGHAVRRNRTRRRLREAFRLERPALPPGLDLVCIPLPETERAPWEALRESVRNLARLGAARLARRAARARAESGS